MGSAGPLVETGLMTDTAWQGKGVGVVRPSAVYPGREVRCWESEKGTAQKGGAAVLFLGLAVPKGHLGWNKLAKRQSQSESKPVRWPRLRRRPCQPCPRSFLEDTQPTASSPASLPNTADPFRGLTP